MAALLLAAPGGVLSAATAEATAGQTVVLSVTADGTQPFTYRWFKDGTLVTGATASDLTLAAVSAADAGTYQSEVANGLGTTLSDLAVLTVLTVTGVDSAPVITANPASQTVVAGSPVTFSASASGTPAPLYQWLKDGVALAGATTNTLSLAAATTADAGSYVLTATNTLGTATSAPAVLTVTAPLMVPVFTTEPVALTVTAGAPALLTAAASGNPTPVYQWRKNGLEIVGATNATFALATTTTADSGSYSVVATNSVGSATSAAATLTVQQAPVFTTQPVAVTVVAGASATFTSAASGNPTPVYQWRKNGLEIVGATNATFAIATTTTADSGSYSVVATNSVGSATSAAATLTVQQAPVFTTQPVAVTVVAGASATFTSAASGNPTPTYQWRKDGVALAGATNASYTIAATTSASAGSYTVVATNSVGSATSAAVTLTVQQAPVFTLQPVGQNVIEGGTVSLTASASGSPAPTYQWYKDGTALLGVTGTTCGIANVKSTDAGSYSVIASNSAGSATSATAILTVSAPPSAPVFTTQPLGGTVVATSGAAFSFTSAASGSPAPTYQWRKDGVAIPGATAANLTVSASSPAAASTYTVIATNAGGSTSSASAVLKVVASLTRPVAKVTSGTTALVAGGSLSFAKTLVADFNGDTRADLVLQNLTNGSARAWLVTSLTSTAMSVTARSLTSLSSDWRLSAAADINHDGHGDLVWQSLSTGSVEIHLQNGTSSATKKVGTATVTGVPADWQVVGAADFSGDLRPDVLFQDARTGERYVLTLSSLKDTGLLKLETSTTDWQTFGAGDFNADGATDLLLQNVVTGECQLWLLSGTTTLRKVSLGVAALDWEVTGAADFNRDGRSDLIWENGRTGERAVWLMTSEQTYTKVSLPTETVRWVISN